MFISSYFAAEDRELLNLEYNIRDTQHNLALQYRLEVCSRL